jgi:hypothetical protein
MRPDMAKVVTERPRRGHSNKSKKTALTVHRDKYEDDDHGSVKHKVSRRCQYGWDAKAFSDLLGPLRGYLKKQVGRPWDKVYSELSQHLDKRSISGQHIWDHVWLEVQRHCYLLDGQVMETPKYSGTPRQVSGLYIHPSTGLLCYKQERRRWRYRPKKDPDLIQLDEPLTELRRMEGIWYHMTYEAVPQFFTVTDAKTGETFKRRGRDLIRIKSKTQLPKQRLVEHGLTNAPEVKPVPRRKLRGL